MNYDNYARSFQLICESAYLRDGRIISSFLPSEDLRVLLHILPIQPFLTLKFEGECIGVMEGEGGVREHEALSKQSVI